MASLQEISASQEGKEGLSTEEQRQLNRRSKKIKPNDDE
ncbi:uncharacterized protein G2W53_009609 [Senna tora]|uniref:Uncharacterized protein n=1 Tax=Senna tora TaxID=362788 RepID=A0A835CA76_9FABA|nr:uncharacterized protein G2W53_009609 [Senna tora]